MKRRNKLEHCYRSLTVLKRSTTKCTTKPVGKMLDRLTIVFEETAFKEAFCSLFCKVSWSHLSQLSTLKHTLYTSLSSWLVSEQEQICGQKLRMRYRMSVIYGHPVIAATRALRFADHVTKRNVGSGDENGVPCGRARVTCMRDKPIPTLGGSKWTCVPLECIVLRSCFCKSSNIFLHLM